REAQRNQATRPPPRRTPQSPHPRTGQRALKAPSSFFLRVPIYDAGSALPTVVSGFWARTCVSISHWPTSRSCSVLLTLDPPRAKRSRLLPWRVEGSVLPVVP